MVRPNNFGGISLHLAEEVKIKNHTLGINALRFRKIRPDAHERCEDEFITLLNRTKVSA